MTEMISREFSRKSFVKGGGAMIVGFSVLGAASAGERAGGRQPVREQRPVRPVPGRLVDPINADNTASIKTGGIRQGTGSDTGLLMIAGEELDMEMSQLLFVDADTNVTPDTGKQSASNTIKSAGPGVRAAAA